MAKRYAPRRAPREWIAGAPGYVLAAYDNGGRTIDRYTVLMGGPIYDERLAASRLAPALFMSSVLSDPRGVSLWVEIDPSRRDFFGERIRWTDLPAGVRQHVIDCVGLRPMRQ